MFAVFAASLATYLLTLAPTVTSEDSGEFIAAAWHLGVAHPPGYPLWTLLTAGWVRLVPFGTIAWRANLFSAVCAAAACTILCKCLLSLQLARVAAIGSSLTVAFGAVFWSQSVITEVYTLHAMLVATLLWTIIKWHQTGFSYWLVAAAATVGLGMANHHTFGFVGVGAAFWIVARSPGTLRQGRLIAGCACAFVLALTPYVAMLICARSEPPMNWGNIRTVTDLVDHVNRKQYKRAASEPSVTKSLGQAGAEFQVIGSYWLRESTSPVFALAGIGFLLMARRARSMAALIGSICVASAGFFVALSGIDGSRASLWSCKVFFFPLYMMTAFPLAYAWSILLEGSERFRIGAAKHSARGIVGALALATPLVPLVAHARENNYSRYWYALDHAENMLACMLPNAIVFPSGDHNTFPLMYATMVEGIRPDVIIADKYGYIDPALYADMPGFHGRKPGTAGERREIEEWLIRTSRRPVYYTVKQDALVENAAMEPVGLLYHLLPAGKGLDSESCWQHIRYRNLVHEDDSALDYGAVNILADYYCAEGVRAIRQNDGEAARRQLRIAASYAEGIKELHNNIGSVFADHGMLEDAVTFFRRAAEIDPDYVTARWNLARVLKAQRRWEDAAMVFEELASITPLDFRVFGELGFLIRLMDGPLETAVQKFEESLRLNPSQPQIIKELATIYESSVATPESVAPDDGQPPVEPADEDD